MGGDPCEVEEGGKQPRQTELRIACSPDPERHLLMREPQQCQYVMVLYEPSLCEVPGFGGLPGDLDHIEL